MNERNKNKLYNIGLNLTGWLVVAVIMILTCFLLPPSAGFWESLIISVIVSSIVSFTVFSYVSKLKR